MQTLCTNLRENEQTHNSYDQERREQACVRRGDVEGLKQTIAELAEDRLGVLSKDSLRNLKDIAIVVITLSSRSAIEGGLPPETAFSMTDVFIQQVEEEQDIDKIKPLYRKAEQEFCLAVRNNVHVRTATPLVFRCRNLIAQNIHKKLTVTDLAQELHTNPDYLSQLFSREEGLSLSEYIAKEKVKYVAKELMFSDKPINDIAASLNYSSQSHLGRVFKKITGMTPQQYRKIYGEADKPSSQKKRGK